MISDQSGQPRWEICFQSRSGPPNQPWLEPDICDRIKELHEQEAIVDVVVQPLGFISDHMEVLFDLDIEAATLCKEMGMNLYRVPTAGTHPKFISMIRELIVERMTPDMERRSMGNFGPSHDICPENCCLYPRPARPPRTMAGRDSES